MENISKNYLALLWERTLLPCILTNLYLAKLENILKEKSKGDPNMVWPIFFKRYIDDGFGITKGSKSNVEYWILEFNKLVTSIKIDKFKYGSKVEHMDLIIFKGNRFHKVDFLASKSFKNHKIFMLTFHKKVLIKNIPSKILWLMSSSDT